MTRTRLPFDFGRRVKIAKHYLDDGAYLTCADRLEALATHIRECVKSAEERALKTQITNL